MSDVSTIAKTYIGKLTYEFGADDIANGKGDCSAFTHEVFNKKGVEIGRDTNAQWSQGTLVEVPQKNDLVFFKDTYENNHTDGVSHVGISLGNNLFIHLGSGGVKIGNLNSKYWKEHYLGARRINVSDSSETDIEQNVSRETSDNFITDIIKVILLVIVIGVSLTFLTLSLTGQKMEVI